MGRFHKYSWHNVALIASQCPTATRVAGFQTWRTMGRFVRKGEKGIAILAPIVGRRNVDSADDSKSVLGFRAAYVFDLAQTDGEPLPDTAKASGDPGSRTAALRAAIVERGSTIEAADDLGGALGTSGVVASRFSMVFRQPRSSSSSFTNTRMNSCIAAATGRRRATSANSKPRRLPLSSEKPSDSALLKPRATTFSSIEVIVMPWLRRWIAFSAPRRSFSTASRRLGNWPASPQFPRERHSPPSGN